MSDYADDEGLKIAEADIKQVDGNASLCVYAFAGQKVAGESIKAIGFSKITAQVDGSFFGAKVSVYGSTDGINFHVLRDKRGNKLSFDANGLATTEDFIRFINVYREGGTEDTDITVTLLMK